MNRALSRPPRCYLGAVQQPLRAIHDPAPCVSQLLSCRKPLLQVSFLARHAAARILEIQGRNLLHHFSIPARSVTFCSGAIPVLPFFSAHALLPLLLFVLALFFLIASSESLSFRVQDVGQAILESYSRVLETVASNLLAGISHVLDSHEEAYSLGKALRASTDYSLNQDSPTSLLTNPAPTPPKTPGDSDRSSGLTGSELEGEDASGGVANAPAGNPLQQWVVLEGRSAQSAQNPGKGMDVLRTAVGRLAGPSREYQVGT